MGLFVAFSEYLNFKGGLISEGNLTLVQLPTKGAKSLSWAENFKKLFIVLGGRFKFSAKGERFGSFCWQWDQSQNTF